MYSKQCQPLQIFNHYTKTLSFKTSNTYVGKNALKGQQGIENSAFGAEALGGGSGNNSGSRNTAIGRGACYNNTTGERNTALGFDALNNNQTGILNTAIGSYALVQLVNGQDNTACGRESLANLGLYTESENNNSAYNNTGVGAQSGVNLGYSSANNYNNTFLGANSDVMSKSTSYNNSTAVGAGSKISKSNELVLGTSSTDTYIPGTLSINSSNINGKIQSTQLYIYDENGKKYAINLTPVNE